VSIINKEGGKLPKNNFSSIRNMEIIDGIKVSQEIRKQLKEEVKKLGELGIVPKVSVILVGNDFASRKYVNSKQRVATELGIISELYEFDEDVKEEEIIDLIKKLNKDDKVHGILVQLPLPKHINKLNVFAAIDVEKDVDGFHVHNVGNLLYGEYNLVPCTPLGIMKLLEAYDINVEGKKCLVIGRSNIVGKPIAMLLLNANATVTIAHSKTTNLIELTKEADLIVSAVGSKDFITGDMIKSGAIIIDVGINRDENDKVCGDVNFDTCKNKALYISKVPGGVGPMTITMLLSNCVQIARKKLLQKTQDNINGNS